MHDVIEKLVVESGVFNYEIAKTIDDENLYKILCKLYPDYDLYNMSTAWRTDREYILKAKGAYGDVIITWA